jgi:ketosteroid isomerase-like protein
MSAENVEVIRRMYAWFAAGEGERAFEVYDPEVEWDATRAPWLLELGFKPINRGHQAVRDALRAWLEAWETIEYEPDELIDAGDKVLAFVRITARGRASGAEVSYEHPQLWTLRGGKVVRMEVLADRDEALRTIGAEADA